MQGYVQSQQELIKELRQKIDQSKCEKKRLKEQIAKYQQEKEDAKANKYFYPEFGNFPENRR